jgi:3-methyl-2-oxobutanoate hydroxymethyltransferase
MTILDFPLRKSRGQRITMTTCYDASLARIISTTPIDCVLVGDSCAMVIHGHDTTLRATVRMLASHTRAVRAGAPASFIIADMPFLSVRRGIHHAIEAAGSLVRAGANAVKIEGIAGNEETVSFLVESGIPVMGHLGLTPQFYHSLGGWRVQGRTEEAAAKLAEQARAFQNVGAFSLVLECVPENLATSIAKALEIPVIGIGAGRHVDGQVLVLHDLLGLSAHRPGFARSYIDGAALVTEALGQYCADIQSEKFPADSEVFTA